MAVARAVIKRSTVNGPYVYDFQTTDAGGVDKAEINIATVGAAIDLIKPQVAALPGTIQRVMVIVTTS